MKLGLIHSRRCVDGAVSLQFLPDDDRVARLRLPRGVREVRNAEVQRAPVGTTHLRVLSPDGQSSPEAVVKGPQFAPHAQVPGVLVTNAAVRAFAKLFPELTRRDAGRVLRRLASRSRMVVRSEGPHGLTALVPDGARVVLLAKSLPGLAAFVCVGVALEPDPLEDEDEEREAA